MRYHTADKQVRCRTCRIPLPKDMLVRGVCLWCRQGGGH